MEKNNSRLEIITKALMTEAANRTDVQISVMQPNKEAWLVEYHVPDESEGDYAEVYITYSNGTLTEVFRVYVNGQEDSDFTHFWEWEADTPEKAVACLISNGDISFESLTEEVNLRHLLIREGDDFTPEEKKEAEECSCMYCNWFGNPLPKVPTVEVSRSWRRDLYLSPFQYAVYKLLDEEAVVIGDDELFLKKYIDAVYVFEAR